jgi:non-ribosomal peptide synthetase-like protein
LTCIDAARRPAPGPRTLLDIFRASVAAHPRQLAVDAPDATLTYRELDRRARDLAGRLARMGIGSGDRVGIRLPSGTAELYVTILGVLAAGAAYVPVDADDPDARAEWIWAEADVAAVIAGWPVTARHETRDGGRPVTPADDAWVIFTSGSTGRPKAVAVGHRAAAAFVDAEARLIAVCPGDRVLAGLSVAFDASCEEMWLAWRNGAALVPAPRALVRSGTDLGPWLAAQRISVVSTVPSLAAMWQRDDLAGVRLLILGGEACPNELGWRLARAGREVWNTYGPTEATVVTTAARIVPGEPVTIGEPLDGWQVAVLDGTGAPVPPGTVGDLVISGAGLGRYLDPALDAQRYAAVDALGWPRAYRSGDLVRQTDHGLEFVGRCDNQVKIGGRRIDLSEVEAELTAVPGVRAAAVAGQSTEDGDLVLVGYIVTEAGTGRPAVRAHLAGRLPPSLLPILVPLVRLPVTAAGKLDREALPWPPPAAAPDEELTGTAGWLADLWAARLGVRPVSASDDFFDLGGSSLAAAKLVSKLRERFPAAAVADIYAHRTLGELAHFVDQLETDQLGAAAPITPVPAARPPSRGGLQIAGVMALIALMAPGWLIVILAYGDWSGGSGLPRLAWPWLVAAWLVFLSAPGRVLLVAVARRLLLGGLRPGRYPRRSWLATRVWFVDRLADLTHVTEYGGAPWAAGMAKLIGVRVGPAARLGTVPSPAALISIGAGATLESDVDLHGWWIEGRDLVLGEVTIGAGARVGTRALLMPGASVGAGAEVDPGAVVTGHVPAGQRWAGSPARAVGPAGDDWPPGDAPRSGHPRLLALLYAVSVTVAGFLPLAALVPGLALLDAVGADLSSVHGAAVSTLQWAPLIAAAFVFSYALLTALLVRWLGRWMRPGWHAGSGLTGWAAWTRDQILADTQSALFPLYSSLYTAPWLRLMGLSLGRRSEMSTAVGLSPLVRFGATDFVADDVVFNTARARNGWLHLAPITVGQGVFLGNGALINGTASLGDGSLVGVQSTPPANTPAATSWFGAPALEFPRTADRVDPRRTVTPGPRLVAARAAAELVRIIGPIALSMILGTSVLLTLAEVAYAGGIWALIAAAPAALAGAGVLAVLLTAAVKWSLMGRYRAGEHPLWSWFVWRDEILNSCQEELAGAWLLDLALGTPIMSGYLRLMGTTAGRDIWCDTLTITEFDMVTIGDGCAINRRACIETHLFHDRLMRIGPIRLGAGASVGPSTAVLPDTILGEGCCVGGRSVVLRGEELFAGTRWHGAPVTAMTTPQPGPSADRGASVPHGQGRAGRAEPNQTGVSWFDPGLDVGNSERGTD